MKTGILFFLITLFLFQTTTARGQEAVKSIGFRFGSGIVYKYVEDEFLGFETILGFREHGIQFTGLIEMHKPIKTDRIRNLFLYYGGGGHTGYKGYDYSYCRDDGGGCYIYTDRKYSPVIGMDGIIGSEYCFYSIPLAISIDYKPYLEFFGKKGFRADLWEFGFSVKYTFRNKEQ